MIDDQASAQDMPYTNREIREKWHDTADLLQEIKSQTQKTNGAVADLNRWRERINGGAMVAGIFMTIIVMPILCWAIYVLVNIQSAIHSSVVETLQAYDVQLK